MKAAKEAVKDRKEERGRQVDAGIAEETIMLPIAQRTKARAANLGWSEARRLGEIGMQVGTKAHRRRQRENR